MKVYSDIFSGEEIISSSYKFKYVFENAGIEVESSYITKFEGAVDIGCGTAFSGNNEEGAAGECEKTLDIINTFKYNQTSFIKKDYSIYIKGYMKRVKTVLEKKNPERVQEFLSGANAMFKWILENFDQFTFYIPESYDTDNTIILSYYKGEESTPTFLFFFDGLKGTTF